ncbi:MULTISPECIES: hypothetical protein [unclassified Streptomyces]|uniref:hypothetical protein n=1 Tax=unclassified Streptomyces TaxID=2593676 RepID=UPI000B8087B4|nr:MULTISPECIES: hypothetical protein [unclassified Streptomyces]MYT18476.1 hypothetical protein [Streptomyces sp. SID4951]
MPISNDDVLQRLAATVEQLNELIAARQAEENLRCYTPREAGDLLGKSENWVAEAIQARRVPFTYIGRSPRMTAAHIRHVQQQGEVLPPRRG